MNFIKDSSGNEHPLSEIKSGKLKALGAFEDYGIKKGDEYKIHYEPDDGVYYIMADGEIDMNNEIRPDVYAQLIWMP